MPLERKLKDCCLRTGGLNLIRLPGPRAKYSQDKSRRQSEASQIREVNAAVFSDSQNG